MHKPLYKLIDDLLAEQNLMEINYARTRSGTIIAQKPEQKEIDRKIKYVVEKYESDDLPDFFRSLLPNLITL